MKFIYSEFIINLEFRAQKHHLLNNNLIQY